MFTSLFRCALAGAALLALGCYSSPAGAEIVLNETLSGDLGTPLAPTFLGSAGPGLNTVTGTLFNRQSGGSLDPDAFSFTVNAGFQLNSLLFTSLDGPGDHFFAFNNGPLSTSSGGQQSSCSTHF